MADQVPSNSSEDVRTASTDAASAVRGLAVVTGASSGIGAAVARALSASGRPLLLLARRQEKLEALGLAGAVVDGVDVVDPEAVRRSVNEAESRLGPAEVLVNCAGVLHLGEFLSQAPDLVRQTLEVNVIGVANAIRAVLPSMLERRSGTIVNISSVAGRRGFADHVAYCASKHAVEGLSEALRMEVAPRGVRVIVVAPGVVDTPLGLETSDGRAAQRRQQLVAALDGGLPPDAVAAAVLRAVEAPPAECWQHIVLTHVGES